MKGRREESKDGNNGMREAREERTEGGKRIIDELVEEDR